MAKEENSMCKKPGMDDENVEPMATFFDKRVKIYENHMRGCVADFERFYRTISKPIQTTMEPVQILDLGCGTGLELEGIFKKAPNASLDCVDVSGEMLKKLIERYSAYRENIQIVNRSYLNIQYEPAKYDYIVSVLTMHHQDYRTKLKLYTAIRNALKDDACYIEGDYIVSIDEEKKKLYEYATLKRLNPEILEGSHHIDIPFSRKTQLRLFKAAGFSEVDVIWNKGDNLIFVAHK